MRIRPAVDDDLPRVIALTRQQRTQLARWSPVYFNPREGADEGHAAFLSYLVGSSDHETLVLVESDEVVGFFVVIPQAEHRWVDDLCLAEAAHWPAALDVLAPFVPGAWVTCVSSSDRSRINAMHDAGLRVLSRYFVRSVAGLSLLDDRSDSARPASVSNWDPSLAPAHTFGGQALDPSVPGAIVIFDDQGGYVIGSPSVSPPIYDPGGPTPVIDQLVGADRAGLLESALSAAAARGDAQVVVVVDERDQELSDIVQDLGFAAEVLLFGAG